MERATGLYKPDAPAARNFPDASKDPRFRLRRRVSDCFNCNDRPLLGVDFLISEMQCLVLISRDNEIVLHRCSICLTFINASNIQQRRSASTEFSPMKTQIHLCSQTYPFSNRRVAGLPFCIPPQRDAQSVSGFFLR